MTHPMLNALTEEVKTRFLEEKTILSFQEYLELVEQEPARHTRDSARYLRDIFDYYGTEEISRSYGTFTRYSLFDAPFDDGRDRLIGHERLQDEVYGLLTDFVRAGRANKLILLHGPNGSAKSTFISCLMRAMEAYSALPQGAIYSFSWVFPSKRKEGSTIGFGNKRFLEGVDTFAHFNAAELDATIHSDLSDHPLLLLPKDARIQAMRDWLGDEVTHPHYLSEGELSANSARIFDALLKAYQGDISEVYKHIRVERFTISRRYRRASSTVDPQMRVDAHVRQVTADRSLSALPVSLQHLNLFEPQGHLVEGNRGIIEYNDLLKRPVETFKYLLSTCEDGAVRLDQMTLYLDAILIGSCNMEHLQAFKEIPDFASFKGRIELVHVPYLLDVDLEHQIYDEQIESITPQIEVAPDVAELLAEWAVMTRLERPQPVHYPKELKEVIEHLTPYEKTQLYRNKRAPAHLTIDERKGLLSQVEKLYQEPRPDSIYEGLIGASPRELKALIMSAARASDTGCLTPMWLFKELRTLCKQESLYQFLRRGASGSYYQPKVFIKELEERFFDRFEQRLHQAMGLINQDATVEQLKRYLEELTYLIKKERRHNSITGQAEDPDLSLLRSLESRLNLKGSVDSTRGEMIQRIAKWRLENKEGDINYQEIFADELEQLRDSYFKERQDEANRVMKQMVTLVHQPNELDDEGKIRAESTFDALALEGYSKRCVEEVIHALIQREVD